MTARRDQVIHRTTRVAPIQCQATLNKLFAFVGKLDVKDHGYLRKISGLSLIGYLVDAAVYLAQYKLLH